MGTSWRRWLRFAVTALFFIGAGATSAQIRLEDLFKDSKFKSTSLSPNGKYLATSANVSGHFLLTVLDVGTKVVTKVAGYKDANIVHVRWINNERLVYRIVEHEGNQISTPEGLFAVNRDGTKFITLMAPTPEYITDQGDWNSQPRWMSMLSRSVNGDPNSILAVGYFPNGDARPYRVNTLNGRRTEIDFQVPGLARDFVVDGSNLLRVVVTSNAEESQEIIWYRDAEDQPWRKLIEQPTFGQKFSVLGFDSDGKTMFVSAATEDGRDGIYEFDFVGNKPGKRAASDPTVSVNDGLVYSPDLRTVLGVRMDTEPPRTLWLAQSMARLQADIDNALPGLVNVITPGETQAPMLINSYSSTKPSHYYLYDSTNKKLQSVFSARPWIDPKKMSEQLAYDYVARDGLPILAYLTIPRGRQPKSLPLVVLVHGGPHARDDWGFDPEVQFLAGMGYVVLQPQFRGSTGFGDTHFKKGFAQWGLSMQDDLTDGVMSLVKQGVVDAKRVCIMGASYGGYAVMQGLVKDPDLYRCGINLFGVTNLFYISSSASWGDKAANYSKNTTLGDPDKLRDQFNATSPSKHADAIKAPVFMAYGEKDRRVPLVHGEDMRNGLRRSGKVVEYMELEGEEHGMAKEETRFRVYGVIETFLKKYNPAQ